MNQFQNIEEANIKPIIAELLNRLHGLNLTEFRNKAISRPDLWQDGKQRVICEIKGSKTNPSSINGEILKLCLAQIDEHKPKVFILVVLNTISAEIQQEFIRKVKQKFFGKLFIHDKEAIIFRLDEFPDLSNKVRSLQGSDISVNDFFSHYISLIETAIIKKAIRQAEINNLVKDPFSIVYSDLIRNTGLDSELLVLKTEFERLTQEERNQFISKIRLFVHDLTPFKESEEKSQTIAKTLLTRERNNYWWINFSKPNKEYLLNESGTEKFYNILNSRGEDRTVVNYFKQINNGDIIVSCERNRTSRVFAIYQVTKSLDQNENEGISISLVYLFKRPISWINLESNPSFKISEVFLNPTYDLLKLKRNEFLDILNLSELKIEPKNSENTSRSFESKIASINGDQASGQDHLDISNDINAFAKIMSDRSFHPPLAIALFGQWGSGKSFFMEKLKERIIQYSISENESYCKGIVQIHFNAWSYLDANLWASIVTQIFTELNIYLTGHDPGLKKQIEKELTEKLSISKSHQEILSRKKKENEVRLKELDTKRIAISADLENKMKEISSTTLTNIINEVENNFEIETKVKQAISENESIEDVYNQVKLVLPKEYKNSPQALYEESKSAYTFLRLALSGGNTVKNFIWMAIIIMAIMIIPVFLNVLIPKLRTISFSNFQGFGTLLTLVIPLLVTFNKTFRKIQPAIAAFWNIKGDFEKQIQNAKFEQIQKEKALAMEIEQKKKELETIDSNILDLNKDISVLEFKINNCLSTEALYSFIDKRSNSDDYKKHLGIVSNIRNDFKILSDLFVGHSNEADNSPVKFNKVLQRIVLYIDDLDRCPEDRVIEVLEAVNLLMAFPLFIVVVGVDGRWVRNALKKRHEIQFGETNPDEGSKIETANYLEKIFQIPFHLKPAEDDSIKRMISVLSSKKTIESLSQTRKPLEHKPEEDTKMEKLTQVDNDLKESGRTDEIEMKKSLKSKKPRDEYHQLSQREVDIMQEFSEIIGNNPRSVKRFVNIYQIARAHEGLNFDMDKDENPLMIMFLLALPMGPYREIAYNVNNFILNYDIEDNFGNIFHQFKHGYSDPNNEDSRLEDNVVDLFFNLVESINKSSKLKVILKCVPREFKQHYHFIKRFTFAELV